MVEWDVSESPSGPTGHLVSMKLRALTPDGIRIAIAKEFGLSNYREVSLKCCHWLSVEHVASATKEFLPFLPLPKGNGLSKHREICHRCCPAYGICIYWTVCITK